MKTSRLQKHRQTGFTLIETIIVIALAVIILAGVFGLVPSVRQSGNVSAETRSLQGLVAGVRTLYPGAPAYTGLSESQLITAGKVPQNMVNGTALKSSWGGTVTAAANATAGFDLTYSAVPTSTCIELVSGVAPSFNTVTVGTTVVKAANATVSVPTVTTACGAAATTSVIFNSL